MPALDKTFKIYLTSQGASPTTIKNYLSDFNHFWGWLILTLKAGLVPFDKKDPQTIIKQISPQLIERYKSFLLSNGNPVSTINRRLSTLRQFGQFCLSQTWIKTNPAKKVKNVAVSEQRPTIREKEKILSEFKQSLEKEKVSSITVKNYLSDLRHFLGWIEPV